MTRDICQTCGDNRALTNHDRCSQCMTDECLVRNPRSPEAQHTAAQVSGSIFEEGFRGDGL